MAVITRFGTYSVSGADLTFADADMISGMVIIPSADGAQASFFGISPT